MDFDPSSTSINAVVNRQLLDAVGMGQEWAIPLAAAISALDTRYRLHVFDARWALLQVQAGEMDMTALALSLRPLI